MEVVHERCCGLDVHKKSVVACLITPEVRETRTFGTMTQDLLALKRWLQEHGCTHVAMESTGVYWKPIFNILEDSGMTIMVVNAHHIKAVPGRKTDVKDAEWIAELLRHGLLRPSFIPDRAQRELRELVVYRRSLVEERAREVNRLQKVLEGANIKLGDVASDVTGKSAMDMLRAMIEGEENPQQLAELARGRLRNKKEQLAQALQGLIGPHQRKMLRMQLDHIAYLDQRIEELSQEIRERMGPFEAAIQLLLTIKGIDRITAEEILAFIGIQMSRFPSHRHLAAWCHVAPGNNESAGKRKSGRTQPGRLFVRTALVRAAVSASRSKGTYLAAQYHRIAARRGAKKAIVAVAHSLIVIIYHMLQSGETYRDLGGSYFDRLHEEEVVRRYTRRLEELGYQVKLEKAA